jgi:hypothetical protein
MTTKKREPMVITWGQRMQIASMLKSYKDMLDAFPDQDELREGHTNLERVELINAEYYNAEYLHDILIGKIDAPIHQENIR